jgi:hypothetical protein
MSNVTQNAALPLVTIEDRREHGYLSAPFSRSSSAPLPTVPHRYVDDDNAIDDSGVPVASPASKLNHLTAAAQR